MGGSLLLHGSLLGGLAWTLVQRDSPSLPPPGIEARLVAVAPPAPSPPPAPTAEAPAPRAPAPEPTPRPAPSPAVAESDATAAADSGLTVPAAAPPAEDAAPEPVAVEPLAEDLAPAPLNPLPPRIAMRFQVRYGLASGEQNLLWVNEGGRYTVSSVAEATGLAGVFYRGRLVQMSHGRITPHGLQPEEFWDQRGDKRSSARFGASEVTVVPAKGAPRHFAHDGSVQDVLSLFFQLALTAPPPPGQLAYTVFNGKKLREYRYEPRGEIVLETALGSLRTLHLARVTDADGRFEVWLAIDRHYLPVRVLRRDDDGNAMELRVQSIAP